MVCFGLCYCYEKTVSEEEPEGSGKEYVSAEAEYEAVLFLFSLWRRRFILLQAR